MTILILEQAYHSIFLQDQDVRVIGQPYRFPTIQLLLEIQSLLPALPKLNNRSEFCPSPSTNSYSRPSLYPRRTPCWYRRSRHRPRQRVLRSSRRSPLSIPCKYILQKFRDQRTGGSIADIWHSLLERLLGKGEAFNGQERGREGMAERSLVT